MNNIIHVKWRSITQCQSMSIVRHEYILLNINVPEVVVYVYYIYIYMHGVNCQWQQRHKSYGIKTTRTRQAGMCVYARQLNNKCNIRGRVSGGGGRWGEVTSSSSEGRPRVQRKLTTKDHHFTAFRRRLRSAVHIIYMTILDKT